LKTLKDEEACACDKDKSDKKRGSLIRTGQAGWQEELALAKQVVSKYEHDEVLLTAYEHYIKYISRENPSLNLGSANSKEGKPLPHVMELSA